MSDSNIRENLQGITKDAFKKALGYKDGSNKLEKALNIFDEYDKDKNNILDSDEQDSVLKALTDINNDSDRNITRKEVKRSGTKIFKKAGSKVSKRALNTLNQLIPDKLPEPSPLPSKPEPEVLPEKKKLTADKSSVIIYLLGENIEGIDVSKEINFTNNSSIEYKGKIFEIRENKDSITFVNESMNGDEKVYTTLSQMIADSDSDDKANNFFNRGDIINNKVEYNANKITSSNKNAVRQEQTIAAAILNSNNQTTIRLNKQKTKSGLKVTDGNSMAEFIGSKNGAITKQDLINFLIAVEKEAQNAEQTPARRYAKDIDIDVKDLVNINAVFNHYAGEDGVLSPEEFTSLIEDLKKSNMANLAKNLIKTDKYEPQESKHSHIEAAAQSGIPIEFADKKEPKTLGKVDTSLYTDFEARKEYLLNRYGDNTGVQLIGMSFNGRETIKVNDKTTIYKTKNTFRVVTQNDDKTRNISITALFKNGLFQVTDTTVPKVSTVTRYYLKNGQEVEAEEFYKKMYNFDPDFENPESKISYSESGIEYQGDSYSVKQDGNIIYINNKSKNKTSTVDLDFLLRDISDIQKKSELMAVIQNLPGEVLEDLSAEIKRIIIKNENGSNEAGSYENDTINIDPYIFNKNNDTLRETIVHELGHAVDENQATDTNYVTLINRAFSSEVTLLDNKLGGTYEELGLNEYTDRVKQKINSSARSGYAAKDMSENFAERYVHMMLGKNNSQEILGYFANTFKLQLEHINKVRTTEPDNKTDANGSYRIDNILRPYLKKKDSYVGLANKFEISKSGSSYTGTLYQEDGVTPLKIIKFNSEIDIEQGSNPESMFFNASHVVPSEIVEYSLTNPDIAFRTIIDNQNRIRTERFDRE